MIQEYDIVKTTFEEWIEEFNIPEEVFHESYTKVQQMVDVEVIKELKNFDAVSHQVHRITKKFRM